MAKTGPYMAQLPELSQSTSRYPTIGQTDADPKLDRHSIAFAQYLKNERVLFKKRWLMEDLPANAKLEDFKIIRTLGTGGFGKVVLTQKLTAPDKNFYFAMKMQEKEHVTKVKQLDHLIQEVRIMDAVNFPFLIRMHYFFKNNCYILMVMSFLSGGELFQLISKLGKLSENMSKFYAAQVILALEYLHFNGVIYRDLKPENVMIDSNGYIKIVDFGFCKKIDDNRTYTLCGTPDYLAPELILSKGYNRSVDFWTLGVLIYEMNAGCSPFYSSDAMKLYTKIVTCKYTCPRHFSKNLQHLIANILQVDRDKRYGILKNGAKDIKGHAWFRGIDWEALLNQKAEVIYKPTPEHPADNTNFAKLKDEPLKVCETDKYAAEFAHMTVKCRRSK